MLQIDDFSSSLLYLPTKRTLLLACHCGNDRRLHEEETGRGRLVDVLQCHETFRAFLNRSVMPFFFFNFYLFPNCSSKQLFDCISNESNPCIFFEEPRLSQLNIAIVVEETFLSALGIFIYEDETSIFMETYRFRRCCLKLFIYAFKDNCIDCNFVEIETVVSGKLYFFNGT